MGQHEHLENPQGYLAHKETTPLGPCSRTTLGAQWWSWEGAFVWVCDVGYLAHKKRPTPQEPPKTLGIGLR